MCFLLRSGGALRQAPMHLCLHSVGLYTFTGRIDDSRAVIVEPTDLTVAFTPPTTQNSHNHQSSSPVCGGLQVSTKSCSKYQLVEVFSACGIMVSVYLMSVLNSNVRQICGR